MGSTNKRAIEDHFDIPNEDLLVNLRAGGDKKKPYIDMLNEISNMANFVYVRQKGPYGNATPLLSAAHLIGDEPFIYKFADDFFTPEANATNQLIETALKHDGGVFACKRVVSEKEYGTYGFAAGEQVDDGVIKMSEIIEKPGSKEASPSDLASVSGYLFPSELLGYIERGLKDHESGEFTLQPFVQQMIEDGHHFYAREIQGGNFHDTGDKLEYLKTTIDFGLKHPDLGPALREFMSSRLSQ